MKEEMVELVQYYNKKGVCIKRTVNGVEISADTEPSVVFLEDYEWAESRKLITQDEFIKSMEKENE